jgi:uncharacterized protein (DUF2384 family)
MGIAERSWRPALKSLEFKPESDRLISVAPQLERLVAAVGSNVTARLLGVDPAQVSRWVASGPISAEMARRILDVHDVLTRTLRLFARDVAARWLFGSEPLLGGARPIDVLALEGSAPVIRALNGIAQGAYS